MPDKTRQVVYPLLFLLASVPIMLWHGLVLSWLWRDFVVPLGVPEVNAWHAAGLVLVIGWLTHNDDQRDRPWDLERLMLGIGAGLLSPLIVLGAGALFRMGAL